MKYFTIILSFLAIFSCNSGSNRKVDKSSSDCSPGIDTFRIVSIFTKDTSQILSRKFYSITDFIVRKDFFKPVLDETGKIKITRKTELTYMIAYDSCNNQRYINKFFVMKNINDSSCDFKAVLPEKGTNNLFASLHFEEWIFANNPDRDSAYKIVNNVYKYPNNIVDYNKHYSQFIIDDKRIFLLEARARFGEQYAIEYKNFITSFIKQKK